VDAESDAARALLRHTIATVAYRGGKVLRGAPPDFSTFRSGETTRTPGEILAHVCDLFDWALWLVKGEHRWHASTPQAWEADEARFHDVLGRFDAFLASEAPIACPLERLFQGPIADALTHVGQLALLRRAAGAPVRGENYYVAEIVAGRTGPDQAGPRREFE
jgi:hypothetical protein